MLQPAHQGYLYQDVTTACVLVRALIDRFDEVIVDRKQVDDDRIDDLEVRASGRRIRRQIKSSQNEARTISDADFHGQASSLRIDRLVLTHVRDQLGGADEYRLCATWLPPLIDNPLHAVLRQVSADPTIFGSCPLHFKLDGSAWWPENAVPTAAPLLPYSEEGAEFGRAEFLAFCERFVIELKLPSASSSLMVPGLLEASLVEALTLGVGIGRYPNAGRTPTDVAALAIGLATQARTRQATLSPTDIERELAIRTDFGRVAQAFSLDEATYCDRPTFRQSVKTDALKGNHQLILGPPGAGKSWDVTRLADDLRNAGAIVARHYCYLEPGDEQVERRITTDVFFANLLAELVDAKPSLRDAAHSRYAAGMAEFEEALQAAAKLNSLIVVIVDGLDHIARVRAGIQYIASDETDIVERIASLTIPPGVVFVLGSQPGSHLDSVRERWAGKLVERTVPPWTAPEVLELANRHGLESALTRFGISTDGAATVHHHLARRADGNPLYARYLSKGLVSGLSRGSIASPTDWLNDNPAIGGDIAAYYAHLYSTIIKDAQIVADVIGVIDFSVTRNELQQMFPLLVGWIPVALEALAPVLTSVTGQGGFRVFHESFRRFMMDDLQRQGRSLEAVLAPVVDWLEKRDFYSDAKSFRFLLPALRRSNRTADIFKYVTASFVSESVAQAHPLEPIERNLALAADVAGRTLNWPALVRCAELQRTAGTCFDDGTNNWDEYWPAYIELFGAAELSQRLLFDGKPLQSRSEGLIACSLIDDAGGVAPWVEYLGIPGEPSGSEHRDPDEDATVVYRSDSVGLAAVHGRLRLGQRSRVLRRALAYFRDAQDDIQLGVIRSLGARLARMLGIAAVERIARLSDTSRLRRKPLSPLAAAMLRLGASDEALRVADKNLSAKIAERVLQNVNTVDLALICVQLGAPVAAASRFSADPSTLAIAVGPDDYLHSTSDLARWISLVRLAASDPVNGAAVLAHERERIRGVGWYRCWLLFVIELAVAEAAALAGKDASVLSAFQKLLEDMHPFRGTPRACDLYKARGLIRDSIARGLSLITDPCEWQPVLEIVSTVSENTASRLDQEDGGPLSIGAVLDVLQRYVSDSVAGPMIREMIEREVRRCEEAGTYYSTHAEYAMRLARAKMAAGDEVGAVSTWTKAAQFLTGYGWRKDSTLFDLLDCIPALGYVSNEAAFNALTLAQPLTAAVIRHTDGRSTKHTPNAWVRSLAKVDAAAALAILAETTLEEEDGVESWPVIQAIQDAIELSTSSADPILADAVLSTLRFEPDHDSEAGAAATARLAPILGLAQIKPELVPAALRRAAVDVRDDGRRYKGPALAVLRSVATHLSIPLQLDEVASAQEKRQETSSTIEQFREKPLVGVSTALAPPFPANATLLELLVGLRGFERGRVLADSHVWDCVLLPLSYHISSLLEAGRDDDVLRLLRYFAREIDLVPNGELHPLGELAEALDNAGHSKAAAYAYALAYTSTRGGGGWLRLGDKKHRGALDRALALDRQVALKVVGEEVAYTLNGSVFGAGISRHLVERISEWGEPQSAYAAWKESYDVISKRLPLAPGSGWFSPLIPANLPGWSVDEALVAVLLGRLSEPRLSRKVRALDGLYRAIVHRPTAMHRPLQWWLTRNSRCSSVLLVLDLLLGTEPAPYTITQQVVDVLTGYAGCGLWGMRVLASRLLERIGVTIPPTQHGSYVPAPRDPPLTEQRARRMRAFDVGNVLAPLSELIPELAETVLCRVSFLVGPNERFQKRFEAEYRLSFGRDGKSIPATPILWWGSELFVVAIHEALSEYYPQIWARGKWSPGLDDEILMLVLPEVRLHLGLCNTRTLRPSWPKPMDLQSGIGDLPTVPADDAVYPGWTRLAIVEVQYVRDASKTYSLPIEKVCLWAGVVAIPPGSTIPAKATPLLKAHWDRWLGKPNGTLRRAGPLAAVTRHTDWLGDRLIVVPPVILETLAEFTKPEVGEPFVWREESGEAAVVLRTWNVRDSTAMFVEPVELDGCDLIVRPDIAARLQNALEYPMVELRDIDRSVITVDPDDE